MQYVSSKGVLCDTSTDTEVFDYLDKGLSSNNIKHHEMLYVTESNEFFVYDVYRDENGKVLVIKGKSREFIRVIPRSRARTWLGRNKVHDAMVASLVPDVK